MEKQNKDKSVCCGVSWGLSNISGRGVAQITAVIAALLMATSGQARDDFGAGLTLSGYSGVLEIPNAEVTPYFHADVQYNNHLEPYLVDQFEKGENYLVSMGVFQGVELGGRLAARSSYGAKYAASGYLRGNRDLSGNLKVQLLRIPNLPKLAIGVRDFAGEAQHFSSGYLVASHEVWNTRWTLGYAFGPDRRDGAFGGLEWRVTDGVYMLAERGWDDEYNAGLRLANDSLWPGKEISLSAKLYSSADNSDQAFGLGLRIPLGNRHHNARPLPQQAVAIAAADRQPPASRAPVTHVPQPQTTASRPVTRQVEKPSIAVSAQDEHSITTEKAVGYKEFAVALHEELKALGFEELHIGVRDERELVIWLENKRYNHNFLDGLGLALGVAASKAPATIDTVEVRLLENRVAQFEVRVGAALYREFLDDPAAAYIKVSESINAYHPKDDSDGIDRVIWYNSGLEQNKTWSQLILQPNVRSYVGTEYGVIDYSLALQTDLNVPLWKGGMLTTSVTIPAADSHSFRDGGRFESEAHEGGLQNLMVQQLFKPYASFVNLTSAGQYSQNDEAYYAAINESLWNVFGGNHQLRLKLGYFDSIDNNDTHSVGIGTYRYLYSPMDLSFEASYGQFWHEDKGGRFILNRFFGDTTVSLFYKYIDGDTQNAGLAISLPLTPRRDPRPSLVQVKGTDRWQYALATSLNRPEGGGNLINFGMMVEPHTNYSLVKDFMDSDRMEPAYLRRELLRMRDAYIEWGIATVR